jgi:DNA-binding MarR family transcriptional regulator
MPHSSRKPIAEKTLEDLPFYLVRTAIAFRRLNDRTLRAAGMKSQPLGAGSVLQVLIEEKSCTVKNLVERTQIPNGTLTGVLNGLERNGFIRRVENTDDGRSWLIELAPKGKAMRQKMQKRHRRAMKLFDDTLSADETMQLKRLLQRLISSMNQQSSPRGTSKRITKHNPRAAEQR